MKRLWGLRDSQETHLFVADGQDPVPGASSGTIIRHRSMSRTSDVISPFGRFVYDTNEAPYIADQLRDLAQIIERGSQ